MLTDMNDGTKVYTSVWLWLIVDVNILFSVSKLRRLLMKKENVCSFWNNSFSVTMKAYRFATNGPEADQL